MTEGDVALSALPQAEGRAKLRPAVLLRRTRPFGDWRLCGISTQLQQEAIGFDDTISPAHDDFRRSGLASLIRLGFLATSPANQLLGILGSLASERHQRLLKRLGTLLFRPLG